jgi:hypothetical protein
VRFALLTLADGSSVSEGKLNLLGVGVRKLQPPRLPANMLITIAGMVEGTADEGGTHRLELTLIEPNGREVPLLSDNADLPTQTRDPDLPVNMVFAINLGRTYVEPWLYRLQVAYADVQTEYDFKVEPKRRRRPRGAT